MLQFHVFLCWRFLLRCLTSCIFLLCFNGTSFLWLTWWEQLGMTHCQVIKHTEKEPSLSFTCANTEARPSVGMYRSYLPPLTALDHKLCKDFQMDVGHQIHLRIWTSECPIPTPTEVVSSPILTQLDFSAFPLTSGLPATQGETMEGFYVSSRIFPEWDWVLLALFLVPLPGFVLSLYKERFERRVLKASGNGIWVEAADPQTLRAIL